MAKLLQKLLMTSEENIQVDNRLGILPCWHALFELLKKGSVCQGLEGAQILCMWAAVGGWQSNESLAKSQRCAKFSNSLVKDMEPVYPS